ncbi:hypothetical protein BC833DRAFT_597565 [Globomyces pollinis-pini]|nr:hypothetical protein BC833DRAFT_597565 [Globomyces pollinis-pini]
MDDFSHSDNEHPMETGLGELLPMLISNLIANQNGNANVQTSFTFGTGGSNLPTGASNNQNESDAESDRNPQQANEGDVRSQMLNQLLAQLQQTLMQNPDFQNMQENPEFRNMFTMYGNPGDYAMGQGGLDSIITRLMEMHDQDNRPPAASEEVLNTLPRLKFESDLNEHKECPVCQDDFTENIDIIRLPCQHIFHPNCILDWLKLNGTCPVCRYSLVDSPVREEANTTEQPSLD